MEKNKKYICKGKAVVFDSRSTFLSGFYEIIHKGAITQELIDKSDVFARLDHNDTMILGRNNQGKGRLKLKLTNDALYYEFEIPHTYKGEELVNHLQRDEINKSSFCFSISNEPNSEYWEKQENGDVVRHIYKISGLYDIAMVYNPGYPETTCYLEIIDNNIEENITENNNDIQ